MEERDNKRRQQIFTNERIRCRMSRVVDDGAGKQLGVMPTWKAVELAKSKGLDLMQLSFHDGVAICKMCNYGKYMYEQKQKAKEAKKKARESIQDVKELCFSIRIDDNDKKTKISHAKQFLEDNCKVKLTVRFSKREMQHIDLGKDVILSVLNELEGLAELDALPKAEGRQMWCIVRPKRK